MVNSRRDQLLSQRMISKNTLIILLIITVFGLGSIGIPVYIWKSRGIHSVVPEELTTVSGTLSSLDLTQSTGRKNRRNLIYLSLQEYPLTFTIDGNSYRATNAYYIDNYLQVGDTLEMDVLQEELAKAMEDPDKKPDLYGLRSGNTKYLALERYNRVAARRNYKNVILGVFFFVFLVGILGFQYLKAEGVFDLAKK